MDEVIAAKFDPPVWMNDQIRRDRLLERLAGALSHRLTLIHAPAGYGKTSLLSQWRDSLAEQDIQFAWLTLEREDRDLKRLVQYIVHAIRHGEADTAADVLVADLPPRAALSAIVNGLRNTERPVVLTLDDLHHAASEPVLEFLRSLIRLAPRNCHFVIASRDIPWLGQSVLAAEEQLLEIAPQDLKFSSEEAALLLARGGEGLTSDEICKVLDQTEGWPIAVQLTSLSLKRGIARTQVIEEFSGSNADLARYLTEQVLLTLPEDTREAVVRTALLERLNGELVNLLCDRTDGWLLLDKLEQQGVFLTPVKDDRREYRYHQLFAQYLRDRFSRSDHPTFTMLQRRAARWFADRGQISEAVNHASLSEDHELLAAILEEGGGWRLIPQGMQSVVERGLSLLPDHLVKGRPRLALAQVYLDIKRGEMGRARAAFDRFTKGPAAAELSAELRTEVNVVGDTLADYENQPVELDGLLAREALLRKLPANDHLVLANISETLGAMYYEGGWLERALQPTLAAREHYQALGSVYSDLFTRFWEARIKRAQGHAKEAESILNTAQTLILANFGGRSDLAAHCAAFQAEQLYEQDEVIEARQRLAWALPHMEQSDGWVEVYGAAYFTEARALASEGAFDQAIDVVARARRVAARRRLRQLEMLAEVCELELHLLHGPSIDVARKLARLIDLDALADAMAAESPRYRPVAVAASLSRVRLNLLEGALQKALDELATLRSWANQRGAGRLMVDVDMLAASALKGLAREEESRRNFDEAVGIAMFQDIVRPFIDAHRFIEPCLADALDGGVQIDRFRDQFLKRLAKSVSARRSHIATNSPFNTAEAEILHHLSQGYSNKEIARLIGMSPDTVKYRLKSLFRKIGVSKRRDAVRVSLERGLVESGMLAKPPTYAEGALPD